MLTRRGFLGGAGALLASAGMPMNALASSGNGLKFIFVFCPGGWDTTRVFATGRSNNIDHEPQAAQVSRSNGISWMEHPARPAVSTFFRDRYEQVALVNGLMVRSIAHEICTMISLTGTSSGTSADWPALIAASDAPAYTLPHLVIGGPSFPGPLGGMVSRTGTSGQLEALLSGQALNWSDTPVTGTGPIAGDVLDRYLLRRAQAREASARSRTTRGLYGDYAEAIRRVADLKDLSFAMDFAADGTLTAQGAVAIEALSLGISRCVTLAFAGGTGWDTHVNNDSDQSDLFDQLFLGIADLMRMLEDTPGTTETTLADETVVVVMSEMGRTPLLNGALGKDHWPYTSAMLVSKRFEGHDDLVFGGYDNTLTAKPVDRYGKVAKTGPLLSAEMFGATLLAMADIDPGPHVSGVKPLRGLLL